MTNAEIKVRRDVLLWMLDNWLKDIDNEKEPVCDLPFNDNQAVDHAYKAGAYKARAEINARRLRQIRDRIAAEFDLQSR